MKLSTVVRPVILLAALFAFLSQAAVVQAQPTLTLTAVTASPNATCGDLVVFEIQVSNSFTNILSLQYSVNWDPAKLTYVSHSALSIPGPSPSGDPFIGTPDVGIGILTYSWSAPTVEQTLGDGTTILWLTMQVIGDAGPTYFTASNNYLLSEVVDNSFQSNTCNFVQANLDLSPITCAITGDDSVCPYTSGLTYSGPAGGSWAWSISGDASIVGAANAQSVSVTTGTNCNGSFTLTLNYTDENGCVATCTKTVNVVDTASPVITCPASVILDPDPALFCTLNYVYEGSATDDCDPGVAITTIQGPASGAAFPVGVTTVTLRATDNCGKTADCSFTVTITDPVVVQLGPETAKICKLEWLALASLDALILPNGLGGVWLTSGDGTFYAADESTIDNTYAGAAYYAPGPNDIANKSVLLVLQNSNPGGCPVSADAVEVSILDVDCGTFPWNGN